MKSLFVIALALSFSFEAHAKVKKWNQKMQELRDVLSEIVPQISYEKETDKGRLEKNVKKLSELVHGLGIKPGSESLLPPDSDPSVTLIKDLFDRETKRAYTAIKIGQVEYAKNLLRNTTSYCIACHSRTNSGPDFPTMNFTPRTEKLSPFERGELLSATRQFGAAVDEFKHVVSDAQFAKTNQINWQRAVFYSLTLAVRVKRDVSEVEEIVAKIQNPATPDFLKQYAKGWNKSVEKWKAEPARKLSSRDGLFAEATRLFAEGRSLQDYAADHSGDISFLRASALAHDYLREAPEGENGAKGLFLAGTIYEILNSSQLSPLSELYFESCVRKAPHTETAGQCYRHFEEAIYFGYSGSGGTFIPEDVKEILAELKVLARPRT